MVPSTPDALRERLFDVLRFYYPTCHDEERGGHIAQIDEVSGEVYDPQPRHLVASCRFIANFSIGEHLNGPDWCLPAAEHGMDFLESAHRGDDGGYAWILDGRTVRDDRRSPYGHAFVLLAHARAQSAGVATDVARVADLLLDRFGDDNGLFGPVQAPGWSPREAYRGQNPNMHACEALIAAFEATGTRRYLDRAITVAHTLTVELADDNGRIWEHYTPAWEPDVDYNRHEPHHQFRPWGFQPGHHAEWAKLLASLDRHADVDWCIGRARDLFAYALAGWDSERGGFFYTLDFDDDPVVSDKYGWPVAEAIGAAAALYQRTGDDRYRAHHDRFWSYAEANLVAPGGNWYGKLTADNERVPPDAGPAVEPGYHPIGACYEGFNAL